MPSLILASASPRRRRLLRQAGFTIRVRPSGVDESHDGSRSPARLVRDLARDKAMDVARRERSGTVVGADTIVVLGRTILNKPADRNDAVRMLRRLSGREHSVYTGVAIVDVRTGRSKVFFERTRVRFRTLTTAEVRAYVRSGAPMDKAGAYGIQDDASTSFVEKVTGCFYTVVGFPLSRFMVEWRAFHRTPRQRRRGRT